MFVRVAMLAKRGSSAVAGQVSPVGSLHTYFS